MPLRIITHQYPVTLSLLQTSMHGQGVLLPRLPFVHKITCESGESFTDLQLLLITYLTKLFTDWIHQWAHRLPNITIVHVIYSTNFWQNENYRSTIFTRNIHLRIRFSLTIPFIYSKDFHNFPRWEKGRYNWPNVARIGINVSALLPLATNPRKKHYGFSSNLPNEEIST